MKDFLLSLYNKEWQVPVSHKFKKIVDAFSLSEKIIFYALFSIFLFSSLFLLSKVNDSLLVEIPAHGGELNEGVIGSPRFINPLLAISDTDRDLTALIYSGLLKATPDGKLIPDLAKSYTVSPNSLVYTFTLADNVTFHDGKPVTANDVLFTIQKAQDPNLKSPKRANWDGVTAEAIGDKQIKLTLKQVYSPFLENTTLGILPKHIWKGVDPEQFALSEFNIEPIGSGPFKLNKMKRDSGGIPISYELSSFKNYASGEPFIETLTVRFYANEKNLFDAYTSKVIDSISAISPDKVDGLKNSGTRVEKTPLPRVFGVFFNQNQASVLSNPEVRLALNMLVDKDRIVKEVLNGYGTKIDGPIPPGALSASQTPSLKDASSTQKALALLTKKGWVKNPKTNILEKTVKKQTVSLEFSLSTSNAPELKRTAEIVKEEWEAIGAKVTIKLFESGDLNQNVIRPRKYDALLFGEIVGRDLDLYAFWHSSQRNDPGLNIALYTNSKVDKLLEDARTIGDPDKRAEKYNAFEDEITKDQPAVFIYSPDFIYIIPDSVKGFEMGHLTIPSERFDGINGWYTETEKVWSVFVPKTQNQNII